MDNADAMNIEAVLRLEISRLQSALTAAEERAAETLALLNAEIAKLDTLAAVCREFVRRVDVGEVRSKRTYAAMKEALSTIDATQAPRTEDGE